MTTVVNVRDLPRDWLHDERYAYVGRERWDHSYEEAERGFDGRFGNIYVLRFEKHRDQVLALFERWFLRQVDRDPVYRARVLGLWGKILVCFCAPLPCHGDVLAAWVDEDDARRRIMQS